jgi:rSAM/selenodomain-associated transferase 1
VLLQLFARQPIAGRVKTRLARELGEERALEIYTHCLRHSLSLLRDSGLDHRVWLDAPGEHPLFDGFDTRPQRGRDLGARMGHALARGLETHRKCLLIGSDCLDLEPGCLARAIQRLDHHDLVLTPAEDGGFVLIGASRPLPPTLFDAISWGSEWVLRQTIEQALACGLTVATLHPLRDIDRAADLAHYPLLADSC